MKLLRRWAFYFAIALILPLAWWSYNWSTSLAFRLQVLSWPVRIFYNADMSSQAVRRLTSLTAFAIPSIYPRELYLVDNLYRQGKVEESVEELENLAKQTQTADFAEYTEFRLAAAYLRMAELNNCLADPNPEFCIFPVSKAGVHTHGEWVPKALAAFENLVKKKPDVIFYRWYRDIAKALTGNKPAYEVSESALIAPFSNQTQSRGIKYEGLAGGSVAEDFNGDGFVDLAMSTSDPARGLGFFVNDGKGYFKDQSKESKLDQVGGGLNVGYTDLNNDGSLDLIVMRGGWFVASKMPSSFLLNDGSGKFKDVTLDAGLYIDNPTQAIASADFNNDGLLDIFVGEERYGDFAKIINLSPWLTAEEADQKRRSRLYVNLGNGKFREAAEEFGVLFQGLIKGATWGDLNNDGYQDLVVSVFGERKRVFLNQGPAKGFHFEDASERAALNDPKMSFSTWMWDFNNDGLLDVYVAGVDPDANFAADYFYSKEYKGKGSVIYQNLGDGKFQELAIAQGQTHGFMMMGGGYGDINCDGYLDAYIGTGSPFLNSNFPNLLIVNHGGKYFTEESASARLGNIQKGHGIAFADFDTNGSIDIFASLGGALYGDSFRNSLFMNPRVCKDWVSFKLVGKKLKTAIGARIAMFGVGTDGKPFQVHRLVSPGPSFGSQTLAQTFSLEPFKKVDRVEVIWPDGSKQILHEFARRQENKIHQ